MLINLHNYLIIHHISTISKRNPVSLNPLPTSTPTTTNSMDLLILHISQFGVVVYACNPSTMEVEAGGSEFEVSLGYIMKPYIKKLYSGHGGTCS
jgi:hypothetical protein